MSQQDVIAPRKFANYFSQVKTTIYKGSQSSASASQIPRIARWNNTGSKLACIHNDRSIRVWQSNKPDLKSSTEIRNSHSKVVEDLSWSPVNSDLLVSASRDGSVKIWDTKTKACLRETLLSKGSPQNVENNIGSSGELLVCRYSWDGSKIALATVDDFLVILDSDLNYVTHYRDTFEIYEIDWYNDSKYLALSLGSGDCKILGLDGTSLTVSKVLEGPKTAATSVCFDPKGYVLAVGSNDGIVSLWDVKTWICFKTFTKVDGLIHSISFSHDGEYLAIGYDLDNPVDIVSTSTGDYLYQVGKGSFIIRPNVSWHPLRYHLLITGEKQGLQCLYRY